MSKLQDRVSASYNHNKWRYAMCIAQPSVLTPCYSHPRRSIRNHICWGNYRYLVPCVGLRNHLRRAFNSTATSRSLSSIFAFRSGSTVRRTVRHSWLLLVAGLMTQLAGHLFCLKQQCNLLWAFYSQCKFNRLSLSAEYDNTSNSYYPFIRTQDKVHLASAAAKLRNTNAIVRPGSVKFTRFIPAVALRIWVIATNA